MTERNLKNKSKTRTMRLNLKYGDSLIYESRDGFKFNILEDIWLLNARGNGNKINVSWMHRRNFDDETFFMLLSILGESAKNCSPFTAERYNSVAKHLPDVIDLEQIKLVWPTISHSNQKNLSGVFYIGTKLNFKRLESIYDFIQSNKIGSKSKMYDPTVGCYSDIEYDSICRTLNSRINELINKGFSLSRESRFGVRKLKTFGLTLANLLLIGIVRRPEQLASLKWCDIIPVGSSFNDPRLEYEYDFSELESLQIRICHIKNGAPFRQDIEKTPQFLNQEISRYVLIYRQEYQRKIKIRLEHIGIHLSQQEITRFIMLCPIFFHEALFKTNFNNKIELFKSVGEKSEAFHYKSLIASMQTTLPKSGFRSDRIPAEELRLSNNRVRHTVISRGVLNHESDTQLAKITGVTVDAVKRYIDLTHEARTQIDEKYLGNTLLKEAFSLSIKELKKMPEYIVTDEFESELGIIKNSNGCIGCKSTLGKPIGCYGCINFVALPNKTHKAQLIKAEQKYETNLKKGQEKSALDKLSIQISWIKATIDACDEFIVQQKGLKC
ncbi:hypothetical protein [Aliikangiella sp. IMCC44359]|uniref:hypothetical protein n=1 Tax=Aliikangiella sp. IMCC44359 TaxID=3459125 RepID=UPI00403AC767